LLDTHTFLWAVTDPSRLSARARSVIEAVEHEVLLSVASVWEMAIKAAIGRLALPGFSDLGAFVNTQMRETGFGVLPVRLEHALRVGSLRQLHRDPFDRLLVAQAQVEGLTLVTRDPRLSGYEVETLW
jgi:PIN domain nuclease of toxin-antitoxin system